MKSKESLRDLSFYGSALILTGLLFGVVFLVTPEVQYRGFLRGLAPDSTVMTTGKAQGTEVLKKQIVALRQKLGNLSPGKQYLVINTTENRFQFYKNGLMVRTGLCSTGSYIELAVDKNKTYRFRTPRGVFTIRNKIVDPVWKKPDWAFIEDGVPVPPANDNSRYEYGVLGDYALNLGNGYLIHGTLYQRLLGMSVTHGCIRMDDGDLKFVYENLPVGSKVFIY